MRLFSSLRFHYGRWKALRDAEGPLPAASSAERKEIDTLHRAFAELPVAPTSGVSPNEADWNTAVNRLRELGMRADPRAFQRWDVIIARMAHIASAATPPELAALQADPEWETRWRRAVREVPTGRPIPYAPYPESSEVLIQTAYHVRELERLCGTRVEEWNVVVEFGGGFGGLARLMHVLGFRGRYLIFDLPPFSLLQRYYLTQSGLLGTAQVELTSEIAVLERFVQSIAPHERASLWATWSLSETPLAFRAQIAELARRIGNYCIAYQGQYGDVDNVAYFTHAWLPGFRRTERIAHRPDDYYVAGRVAS